MQATPSRIRSLHRAPQCDPHTEVHRARAPRDQALPAMLHRRADLDRMARDSSTTPQVRRGVVVVARVQVAPVRRSHQPPVHQSSRALLALARAECQQVVARLPRDDASPLSVLFSDTAGPVRAQGRRGREGSMPRGLRALWQRRGDRTRSTRRVRRRSRRPPQRGLAASTAVRALALSLYQSASI
jgi:hypothetical protein